MLKEVFSREMYACRARPRDDLYAEDRIASHLKEVVLQADPLHPEQFCPYAGQDCLDGIPWRFVAAAILCSNRGGLPQPPAVYPANSPPWHPLPLHNRIWHPCI